MKVRDVHDQWATAVERITLGGVITHHDLAARISDPLRQMDLTSERPSQPGIHCPSGVAHHNGGRHIELFSGLVRIVDPDHEGFSWP